MADTADILKNTQGVLKEVRGIINDLPSEEEDVDSRQNRIESFLSDRNPEELSRQELDQLEQELGEEGQEIEDEIERLETAIQDQQQLIEYLSDYEGGIGSEEQQTFQKLENVKEEIRGLDQKMSHQTVDQAINDLENAVMEMAEEADQILGAAKIIGQIEQAEGSELQLESHLEDEVQKFNDELDMIEQLVDVVGGQQESDYASRIEDLRQQVNDEVRTENRQVRQEIQEEGDLVEQIKQEAQQFQSELQEAYDEAQATESRISGGQGFEAEDQELGKIINKIEEEKEKADNAVQMIQKDESFLSKLMNR
jgi:DNA repair exonuclease SbcCD ATPase subunit